MTKKYEKPELIDLKNSKAAGACSGGSAPLQDCASGNIANFYCVNGTNPAPGGPSYCNTGTVVNGCSSGAILG